MASAPDSVSIFAEGTFEEQILELVSFIARNRSDEERQNLVGTFQKGLRPLEGKKPIDEDESRRKFILSKLLPEVRGLGDGTDKENEGFFNLLFAHLFSLYPENMVREHLASLLRSICLSPDRQSLKYRIISNLFNTIPRNSPLRLIVYQNLLQLSVSKEDLNILEINKANVERWLSEWDISEEEKSSFLKSIVDAYANAGQSKIAYEFSLSYVQSLQPSSPAAQTSAIQLIATALKLPSIFDFDPLFKIEAILRAKNHELFSLLQIFLNESLPEFQTWQLAHPETLAKYDIPPSELEHKMRLLALSSLSFKYIGQNLPYSKVADTLKIDASEVETWVIDVIRAGLVWGKLSQTAQSFYITRATARSFEQEQWQALEKRLVAWKNGLNSILDVVESAKRQGQVVSPTNV